MAPLADPTESGFDYFIGQVDQGLCHNMYPRLYDSGNATKVFIPSLLRRRAGCCDCFFLFERQPIIVCFVSSVARRVVSSNKVDHIFGRTSPLSLTRK